MSYEGNECKFVGKTKLIEFLNNNPDFTNSYIAMLTRHISNAATGVNLLNEKDLGEIIVQENSVNANSDFRDNESEDEDSEDEDTEE